MNPRKSSTMDASEEIPALIETLLATKQRLEELTAGEVDTVTGRNGQTFLLGHAQEELRRSQAAKQAAILNALPAHIALLDSQGLIISVNEAWRRFAQANVFHAPGHGMGINYLDVCDRAKGNYSSEAHQVAAGIRAVLGRTTKSFSLEYSCHSPNEQRWFLLAVTPLAEDHAHGAVVMHLNITERRRSDLVIERGLQRLNEAQRIGQIGDWEWNVATDAITWSPQVFEILGRDARQGPPRNYEEMTALFDAASQAIIKEKVTLAITSGEAQDYDLRAHRPDSTPVDVLGRAVPRKDENGKVVGLAGTVQDITERKRSEAELEQAHQELVKASRQAGMAEVATGILHNVGNVLNSVNVASSCVADSIRKSKAANLGKVVGLLREHAADLGDFLTVNPQGRQIPDYLAQLAEHLAGEQAAALKELAHLQKNIEHIKDIVAMQQGFAKVSGTTELLSVTDLVEDALKMNASALARHDILVRREFQEVPLVTVEKHQVLQILVNLVRNAMQACDETNPLAKRITLRVTRGDEAVRIAVTDNGVGIPAKNLTRLFAHGFTTKRAGHGFGLHSAALAAKKMGGALTVHSDGPGQGATFTLELPCSTREETHE